jgi:ribonuclease T2
MRLIAILLTAATLATAAHAAPSCPRPPGLAPAPILSVRPDEVVADVPIAYYLLAITWTPEWRRLNGQTPATTPPLDPAMGRAGFALHGLWPNGKAPPYPRYCHPVGAVPAPLVRNMYCRTPSAALLQHEWQAHGACAWTSPEAYFRQASALYDRVRLPDPTTIAPDRLTAGALRQAFIARNPWLRPEAVYVSADKAGRLSEVRLCYDLAYKVAACPGGSGAPDAQPLLLTLSDENLPRSNRR